MNPRFLGITTSHEWLGLCLSETDRQGKAALKGRFFQKAMNKHSDWIIPRIHSLLHRAGWSPWDLGAIAVDVGPGSFTGVRIGLAVARTLGQSLNVPLIPIPSLDLMAAAFTQARPSLSLACVSRAIPGEVYLGLYRFELSQEKPPPLFSRVRKGHVPLFQDWLWFPAQNGLVLRRLAPLAWMSHEEASRRMAVLRKGGASVIEIGRDWKTGPAAPEESIPTADALGGLAPWIRSRGGHRIYRDVVPLYLQPSWAERRFEPAPVALRLKTAR